MLRPYASRDDCDLTLYTLDAEADDAAGRRHLHLVADAPADQRLPYGRRDGETSRALARLRRVDQLVRKLRARRQVVDDDAAADAGGVARGRGARVFAHDGVAQHRLKLADARVNMAGGLARRLQGRVLAHVAVGARGADLGGQVRSSLLERRQVRLQRRLAGGRKAHVGRRAGLLPGVGPRRLPADAHVADHSLRHDALLVGKGEEALEGVGAGLSVGRRGAERFDVAFDVGGAELCGGALVAEPAGEAQRFLALLVSVGRQRLAEQPCRLAYRRIVIGHASILGTPGWECQTRAWPTPYEPGAAAADGAATRASRRGCRPRRSPASRCRWPAARRSPAGCRSRRASAYGCATSRCRRWRASRRSTHARPGRTRRGPRSAGGAPTAGAPCSRRRRTPPPGRTPSSDRRSLYPPERRRAMTPAARARSRSPAGAPSAC